MSIAAIAVAATATPARPTGRQRDRGVRRLVQRARLVDLHQSHDHRFQQGLTRT
ncbi:hypothetical protein [Fodinicola feengrottensis]|uniref:hypothetical protein n=1 Tax=Fodinicola feengrottensis TaxID=435914 RepID=UPI002441C0E8|nr:hypothetical protein [Fodinicola feengrottensis]